MLSAMRAAVESVLNKRRALVRACMEAGYEAYTETVPCDSVGGTEDDPAMLWCRGELLAVWWLDWSAEGLTIQTRAIPLVESILTVAKTSALN